MPIGLVALPGHVTVAILRPVVVAAALVPVMAAAIIVPVCWVSGRIPATAGSLDRRRGRPTLGGQQPATTSPQTASRRTDQRLTVSYLQACSRTDQRSIASSRLSSSRPQPSRHLL